MGEWIGAVVAVAIIAVVAWLMIRSWRRRTERDETLSAYPVPATLPAPMFETEVLYVATTPASQPLERLAVQGLAFRGAARIELSPEGLVLRIAGEPPTWLPAERLVAAGEATYAIDRGVEPEGLIAVTWIAHTADPEAEAPHVDSYLRARYPGDPARIIAAVNDIAAAHVATRPDQQQESEASDD
ncbi:PH-like domain-containing protein [Agromyces sp. NPDC055661]